MTQPEKITLVLRAPEGESLESVIASARLCSSVRVGTSESLAVIAGVSEGDLQLELDQQTRKGFLTACSGLEAGFKAVESFSIDDHVRMAADARRYRLLRDRACIEDADNDLMVVRGDNYFNGEELDREIDHALRLARLEELHPCAD